MAKTKRKKKSNQEQISEELRTRIIASVCLFLIIIAALKLGIVGEKLDFVVRYLFGNFYGIIYSLFVALSVYVVYGATLPSFSTPKAVGFYMALIGILVMMNINQDGNTGIQVIQVYIKTIPLNRGGLIGAVLYGVLSMLFDYAGAMIAAVLILLIGMTLIFSRYYVQYKKTHKGKSLLQKKDSQHDTYKGKSIFKDFFSKKKEDQSSFFPEDYFEDENQETDSMQENNEINKLEEPHLDQFNEEDQDLPTTFAYNEESNSLDIKDKEELQEEVVEEKPQPKKTGKYRLPSLSLLQTIPNKKNGENKTHALDNAEKLRDVLKEFGVHASISNIFIGPSVTKYELRLETGTRVNRIMQLQDDIKLALAARDIRIEAPIPGKSAIGVEIPNLVSSMVTFKEVFKDIPANLRDNKLLVPLGKDISGKAIYAELNKMPHLLIAGATGSGKSVCVNTIICSILMRAKPDEVKLILVDPKKVELSNYNGIPHLLAPVVTDPKKAAATLREVVAEMERRYDLFTKANVKKIEMYNQYVENNKNDELEKLPYIVVILDEVADLMMVASKDVEDCIMRIAQLARAAGIHLIVATQRPSTDIITGVIKANIPSRIAFAVSSSIDSRTILDCSGAEKLLGKGDMLFSPMGSSSPVRVQGAFVTDEEVQAIVYHVTNQQAVQYDEKYVNVKPTLSANLAKEEAEDEEYEMCRAFVIKAQKASTSLLQRQFRIGYNKAARIIDQLESDGVIGPQIGSKPREVYIRGYSEEDI